jgi:uncharacterized protein YjdB
MTWGKTYCYDAALKAVLQARAMGVKAISKELITIIVSNFMTPSMTLMGPAKPVGMTTDLYLKLFDLFDSQANVTGKIQEFAVGKTVSTDDAIKAISKLDEYVSNRLQIAQECYDGACNIREDLESDATSVIEAIENRHPQDAITRQACEEQKAERGVLLNDPSAEVDETTTGYAETYEELTTYRDRAQAKEAELAAEESKPREEYDPVRVVELRIEAKNAREAFDAKVVETDTEIDQKLNGWIDDMEAAIDSAIESAGFEIFPDDYEFTPEEIEKHGLEHAALFTKIAVAADIDHCDYYHYSGQYAFGIDDSESRSELYLYWDVLPPSALNLYDEDLTAHEKDMKNDAAKLRALAGSIPELFDTFYSSYQEIAAMGMGYDAVINPVETDEEGQEIVDPYSFKKIDDLDIRATRALARINAIPNDLTRCDELERYVDEIREGEYKDVSEKSEDFRKVLRQNASDYNEIKADFDLAFVEYCNDLKVEKELYAQVPDYVKNLNTTPYNPLEIDRNLKALVDSKSNPKHFLKTEAGKLDELYDRFEGIRDELNTDQAYLSCYLQQLHYLEGTFSRSYANLDDPVVSKTYKNNELLELFDISTSLTLLEDDPLSYEEQLVAIGSDGEIYTSDQELLNKYSITGNETVVFNRIPALKTDFFGGTAIHAEFVAAYNELKNRKGTVLRQLKSGDDELYRELTGRMSSAYMNCLDYTYNSRYAGLGNGKVIDMQKEMYDEDGIVVELLQKAGTYIPVEKIRKGGKQNLRLFSSDEDENTDTEDLTVPPEGSGRLVVGVEPFNATYRELVWSSLDPEIAQVDQDGVVTGIEEGTATIQCIASDVPTEMTSEAIGDISIDAYQVPDEFILSFNVTVDKNAPAPSEVEGLILEADKEILESGETAAITATVTPEDASAYLSWSVEPANVAALSSEIEGEYGASASGWRIYVRGLSTGTATVTATADNGTKSKLNITIRQKPLMVCDDEGSCIESFESFEDAKEWIQDKLKESPGGIYRIRLCEDITLDESTKEYAESSIDFGENAGRVSFDLSGHNLLIKRSQYSAIALQTGTVIENGMLQVTGPDGLQIYGDVHIDKIRADRLLVNKINDDDECRIDTAMISEVFIMNYGSIGFVKKLTTGKDIDCMNKSVLAVDDLNVSGKASIKEDALLVVNERAILSGGIMIANGGKGAYLAKNKAADLTINGKIEPNVDDMPLYFGVTDEKCSYESYELYGIPKVMSLDEQTLLYRTSQKAAPKYVRVWQEQDKEGAANTVVYAGGFVFAAALDEEIAVPEVKPVTKLLLDRTSVSIGTGKDVKIRVTALSEDAELVGRPPVMWTENKKGKVIAITDVDYDTGIVTVRGVGAGTASITATATDGSKKKVSCSIKVGTSIESVTITQKKNLKEVEAGKKIALTATILPKKPAPVVKTLIWKSDKPDVASVDAKGNVTGISAGTATIKAIPANSLYDATKEVAEYEITVKAAANATAVSDITIKNPLSGKLAVGKSATLKAYTRDTARNKDVALNSKSVVFYSNNDDVLSVTPAGKLTAKEEGGAIITAVSLNDPSVTASVTVYTYVPVKKITLNAAKGKVKKGASGTITVAQWDPAASTDKSVLWTATGADGSIKTGNTQAVAIAVLKKDQSISDLTDDDFKDARTTPVETGAVERIVYKTLVATKKCVITAASVDGNKKAKYTIVSTGEVTSLSLKTTKTLIATETGYATTIKAGKSLKPGTVIQAEYGADKTIRWSSDSPHITVKNGTIKVDKSAEKGSTATITASAAGGKQTVSLVVTVE